MWYYYWNLGGNVIVIGILNVNFMIIEKLDFN